MILGGDKGQPRYQPSRSQSGTEGIRPPPSKMSDAELLRFGMVAKYMCSQEGHLENGQREALAFQLNEAQQEWNRRFPRLPLGTTFNQDEGARPSASPRLVPSENSNT